MSKFLSFRLFLILALTVMLLSCDYRPMDVLSNEKMAEVVSDVHIAEYSMRSVSRSIVNSEKQEYVESVYSKHGITKEQFDSSVSWYAQNPEEYMLVYEIVVETLKELKLKVEDYAYHPEDKPTYLDSIDTLNIWNSNLNLTYTKPKNKRKRLKQLDTVAEKLNFTYPDTLYFAQGDLYRLRFKMRLYDSDSTAIYNTFFVVHRTDSIVDTVMSCILPDSIQRIYTLTVEMPDSISAYKIEGQLLDTLNEISLLEVDSIEFFKIYNPYKNPLPEKIQNEMEQISDSLAGLNKKEGRIDQRAISLSKGTKIKNITTKQ